MNRLELLWVNAQPILADDISKVSNKCKLKFHLTLVKLYFSFHALLHKGSKLHIMVPFSLFSVSPHP